MPTDTQTAPTPSATELVVTGMTCNNCARHVTEAIQSVPGVRNAAVTLQTGRASVKWNAGATLDVAAVLSSVKAAGFDAKPVQQKTDGGTHDHAAHEHNGWNLNLWLGGIVTAVLMLGEWGFNLAMVPWFQWVAFALAGVVQVVCGAQFYSGAWRQLKVGHSNMDTLVALGSTTAFGYSTWALLSGAGTHLYFMEAAAIITLISIGHWIEARVSEKASGALKSLMQLAPQTARRISSGYRQPAPVKFDLRRSSFTRSQSSATSAPAQEEDVAVSDLKIGDIVALRPGDRVPTDGTVLEGDSAVDETMLTGESVPVDKESGGGVYAGTVNMNGRLVMRVTATGEETALAHIIAAVQRAQTSRADIQRLGDRVSNVFVPIVVGVAVIAGLWWGLAPNAAQHVFEAIAPFLWKAHMPMGTAAGFIVAAAVLIVACPCAMGLATPAAIMAGANAAARRGILIRDGVALEKAGKVTAVIFDKTGTLTVGKPELVEMWEHESSATPHPGPLPRGEGELRADGRRIEDRDNSQGHTLLSPLPKGEGEQVKKITASLARHSTHPISQAVAKISKEEISIADWKEVRGAGVEGNIQHPTSNSQHPIDVVRFGSLRWLKENGVNFDAGEEFIEHWTNQGATIVGLAIDTKLAGLFAVKDTVKSGAASVVQQLHQQGMKTFLLTGDNSLTAGSIARQVGILPQHVYADVRPEHKAEFVKKLQAQGEHVAFVGDGINDAPALEQADLGIAVSRASDVAREAADIILLKSEIEAVPESLGLARATLRTIKQNLFWAFFYNALGIPLAALGFMSPILCAAAMGVSDLVVIGNALRLARWRSDNR